MSPLWRHGDKNESENEKNMGYTALLFAVDRNEFGIYTV